MLVFALAIFTEAFLLFQVQPLMGKFVLPWFGGSPAVWSTCMLFFQVILLAGYAYAHLSDRFLGPRAQAGLHAALLVIAATCLPIAPGPSWKPPTADAPVLRILALLAASVGAPAFVLAASGPLLQRWFTKSRPGASPYPLFALSNLASLLALVSYPFVVEPWLSRQVQSTVWSCAFVAFAVVCLGCIVRSARASPYSTPLLPGGAAGPSPGFVRRALWFLLPCCACTLLLATTSQLCLDVASIPFLWVLPLALYLASFVLCFESARWYRRLLFLPLLGLTLAGSIAVLSLASGHEASLVVQIASYSITLFVAAMVCHGELARLKPQPSRLTSFYLAVAAGGALGGIFVTLVAPRIFTGYFELHAAWFATAVLALVCLFVDPGSALHRGRRPWAWIALSAATIVLAVALVRSAREFVEDVGEVRRDFYGVLEVAEFEEDDPAGHYRVLSQGTTQHGSQFTDPRKRRLATTYYGDESGVGRAFKALEGRPARQVGVVGLGAGTVAAHGRTGDTIRFYELAPDVRRVAETRFTYLADSPARCEVVLGDARLALEREDPHAYDLVVLDAFSSDAIPVHLLTDEAFGVYLRHLRADGILAVNLSNVYVDLKPVVVSAAISHGLTAVLVRDVRDEGGDDAPTEDERRGLYTSVWALLSREAGVLDVEPIRSVGQDLAASISRPPLAWSDDFTPLFPLLH